MDPLRSLRLACSDIVGRRRRVYTSNDKPGSVVSTLRRSDRLEVPALSAIRAAALSDGSWHLAVVQRPKFVSVRQAGVVVVTEGGSRYEATERAGRIAVYGLLTAVAGLLVQGALALLHHDVAYVAIFFGLAPLLLFGIGSSVADASEQLDRTLAAAGLTAEP